eukprot:Lankesteria_metandrocarpae@DN4737_c1_g1_i1.p1
MYMSTEAVRAGVDEQTTSVLGDILSRLTNKGHKALINPRNTTPPPNANSNNNNNNNNDDAVSGYTTEATLENPAVLKVYKIFKDSLEKQRTEAIRKAKSRSPRSQSGSRDMQSAGERRLSGDRRAGTHRLSAVASLAERTGESVSSKMLDVVDSKTSDDNDYDDDDDDDD